MGNVAIQHELITALQWYVDHGITDLLQDEAIDRTKQVEAPVAIKDTSKGISLAAPVFLGKSDACDEAIKLVNSVSTLEELSKAITDFDGIASKKTATNMVFADGNPKAEIMLVGDAPATDEDRAGKPFVGAHGELLDKILGCIDLARDNEDAAKAVYITNVLNWRPPGNRSPTAAEIEVSMPFLEKHIQLIQPKILIICGSFAAKALLGKTESISRLRKSWHDYVPQTKGMKATPIPAIVTYPPSNLLATPLQKKSVWADMLEIQEKLTAAK